MSELEQSDLCSQKGSGHSETLMHLVDLVRMETMTMMVFCSLATFLLKANIAVEWKGQLMISDRYVLDIWLGLC